MLVRKLLKNIMLCCVLISFTYPSYTDTNNPTYSREVQIVGCAHVFGTCN